MVPRTPVERGGRNTGPSARSRPRRPARVALTGRTDDHRPNHAMAAVLVEFDTPSPTVLDGVSSKWSSYPSRNPVFRSLTSWGGVGDRTTSESFAHEILLEFCLRRGGTSPLRHFMDRGFVMKDISASRSIFWYYGNATCSRAGRRGGDPASTPDPSSSQADVASRQQTDPLVRV